MGEAYVYLFIFFGVGSPLLSASVCKKLLINLLTLKKNKTSFFKSWRHPKNQFILFLKSKIEQGGGTSMICTLDVM